MADEGSILVTGEAGQRGAVGRTVTGLLLERGLAVRAMVRREDDRATALRAVLGYLEATVTMAAMAWEVGVDARSSPSGRRCSWGR